MSNGNKISEENCELHKFKKNNYFYGKLMLPEDFQDEQKYLDSKRHMINGLVYGSGIVCGIIVDKVDADAKDEIKIIFKKSGVALDSCGHEIVVPVTENNKEKYVLNQTGKRLTKAELKKDQTYYLYLRYKPCLGIDKVPSASIPSSSEEILCQSTRIEEDFDIVALTEKPCPGTVAHCGTARTKNGDDYIILAENASSVNDYYKNMCIEIIDKTGEGQVRTIKGYTGAVKKATVDKWDIKPDETSKYIIRDTSLICPEPFQINDRDQALEKIKEWVKKAGSICPFCGEKDPKVFLVAINKDNKDILNIKEDETKKYAAYVYNNKLLSDLITCHMSDFDNPHKTTVEQVMALKSINNVGNIGGNYVPNVDLKSSDKSIDIKADTISNSIDITTVQRVDGCTTGVVIFPIEALQENSEISQWIDPQLGKVPISVILGIEQNSGKNIFIGDKNLIISSDAIFKNFPPVYLGAKVDEEGKFKVVVKKAGSLEYINSIRVRWWAFKPDKNFGEVTVVSIWISPPEPTIYTQETIDFTATVTGPDNTDVNWSIDKPDFGNIEATQQKNIAKYTAPDTAGSCSVVATSKADDTKKAVAKVTVIKLPKVKEAIIPQPTNPGITSIEPAKVDLRSPYTGQYFYATVKNSQTGVDWKVEASGGKLGKIKDLGENGDGAYVALYTIPKVGSGETITNYVVVTSKSDPGESIKAEVIVYGNNSKRK